MIGNCQNWFEFKGKMSGNNSSSIKVRFRQVLYKLFWKIENKSKYRIFQNSKFFTEKTVPTKSVKMIYFLANYVTFIFTKKIGV